MGNEALAMFATPAPARIVHKHVLQFYCIGRSDFLMQYIVVMALYVPLVEKCTCRKRPRLALIAAIRDYYE